MGYDQAYDLFLSFVDEYALSKESTVDTVSYAYEHWIEYISEQGFFIELTGDEYVVLELELKVA